MQLSATLYRQIAESRHELLGTASAKHFLNTRLFSRPLQRI